MNDRGLAFTVAETVLQQARNVDLVVFDVDGVMTDGSLYIGASGEEFKRFNVHDGHGFYLLSAANIPTAVISARSSRSLDYRARELGIAHCYTGRRDKNSAWQELLQTTGVNADRCCYVADDVVDLPVLLQCGFAVAVPNAHHVVRQVAHWITPSRGGCGAVREVCELILHAQAKLEPLLTDYLDPPGTAGEL